MLKRGTIVEVGEKHGIPKYDETGDKNVPGGHCRCREAKEDVLIDANWPPAVHRRLRGDESWGDDAQ